jgi:hypothetical protein
MTTTSTAGVQRSTLGAIGVGGTSYFLLVIAAMHFLSPDISPIDRPTSEYATGPFGYLMTSAFVALSAATWSIVIGLWRDLPQSGIHRTGLVFLGVFGTALLIAAAFPIDPEGAAQTAAGTVHRIDGPIAFLSLTIGTNLVSRGFKDGLKWQPIHRVTFFLALLMIPLFVAGGVMAARGAGVGIAQRLLVVAFGAWFLFVATRLRRS